MEIKTHVLTNEQHLDDNRKAMARKNIDAAKKAVNTHEGNLAGFDANGELVDSGIANNKVIQGVSRQIEGQPAVPLTPDEHGCVTVVIPAGVDVSGKADKVSEATAGNFAGLDGFGNLTDSGKSASDFATAAQGAKADTALQEHQDISGKANKSEMDITAVTGDDTKKNIQLMEGLDQDVVVAHQDVSDKAVKSEMVITDVTGDTTKKNIQLKDGLNQDVVVEHQDISGKAEKNEMSIADVSGDETKKTIQLKDGLSQDVVVAHQDISGKAEKSEMSITAVSGDDTKKTIQLKDGLSQDVVVAHQDISGKAEKNEMSITAVSGDDTKKTIQLKDGLSQDVVVAHQDISGKAEKSEMSITDVSGDATKKTIQLKDGLSQDVVIAHQDISGKEDVSNKVTSWSQPTTDANYPSEKLVKDSLDNKADKVSGANAGNLASLTANGNLADSGKRASDFVESVSINGGTAITPTDGNVDLPLAVNNSGTGTDGAMSGADKVKLDGIEPGAEENVQADWTESDNTSDSFIQHKPTDLWHGTPIDQETGNVVTDIELNNNNVPVIRRDNTVMAVPVPDTDRTLLEGKSDGTTDWNILAQSTFGSYPALLDEQTGEPILDEDATDLWATYDGIGFGAARAVADRAGNVIDETYATKTDIANFKPKQTAVTDPTAIGSELEFIDSITQDADGVITPTKKTVQDALTTQKGVVQLAESVRAQVPSGTSLVPTEAAVRTAIDSAVSSAYHHAGTKRAAELSSSLLVAANEGNVYNISEDGTTTADFIEGAGHVIRVGDNVGVCQVSDGVYKFDLLSGFVDLSNYKTKQSAVVDPTASGNGLDFIDSISQDANGEITPTKKTVQDGTTSQKGVVQLEDSHTSTSTTTAATPNSVKEAYDLADGKQDPITFDGTYDATTNPAATVSTVTTATADKADKVTGATSGNFAGLDSNGNLTDSGSKATDFATAAQGAKADSAVQGVQKNGTDIALDANKKANVVVNDADFNVKLGSGSVTKVFSADAANASTLNIPLAAADSSSAPTVYTEGLMAGEDKEKLDGITDYVVSASVSGRTLTLTNKNGPDTTFTDTGDTNVIESISVNGTAQTVTNKNVDLTIPDAANDATITIEVGGAASGETAPVAGDFSTDQDTAETITIPAAVSATQNTPAQPGVMSSADKEKLDGIESGAEVNKVETVSIGSGTPIAPTINTTNIDIPMADYDDTGAQTTYTDGAMSGEDKEKLDNIAAFSSIQVTSGSTTGQVDAESATETLNLVAGDNITLTANDTTKTIEISASLGAELGFLSGSATVNGIVNNGDVLTDPLTGMVNSNNGRFIIDTDTDDGHVYLYALKSVPDLVNGVDLFTISVNSNVSRTTANGFYGVAGLEILHKDNGNSLITESTESYASQVGECSVDLTVTVKNSTGTVTTIDGVDYYGYLIRYAGDSTASGDAINVVTRISVIEETVGIVEYNGSQSSLSAGSGISIDNDTINANLGKGLGLDDNNNIEVKVGAGLKIDTTGVVATVAIDNVTEEVVETVQKLGEDLDKKITTTFPYAQITTMSDYMTYGTQGENRMFGQLFSVPITSELRVDETVICVNALQSAPSIDVVFGIFEYDFSANNGAGSTYWLADTGVVHVAAGDNAFPIKNLINDVTRPSIEMKSSCLYYAVWAIHNTGASSGLMLASCPGYGASYNAIPRYTVKTSGASVQVNWAGDGCLRSSWFSGYNEDNSIPRLFMMVRNKSDIQPSGNDPFIDITDYELNDQYTINQIFGSTAPSANGAVFQKVIPARAVNITKFEWADTKSTVTATSSSPMVMDNGFGTTLTLADGTLTTAPDGDYYVHTFTPTNALAMTSGTVYWLPAQYNTVTETGMSDGGDNKLVQYNTNVARRDLQMIVDMAQPSGSGEFKASQIGVYLKLYDDNNNSWVI